MFKSYDNGIELNTIEEVLNYDWSGFGWGDFKDFHIYCLIEYERAMRKKDVANREFFRLAKNFFKEKWDARQKYFEENKEKLIAEKKKELGL